jgi:phosphoenolpyruvate-protein kinase (PTS system EI component)
MSGAGVDMFELTGIRQLSMSPLRTNAVRGRIRSLDSTSCRALADEAMLRGSARAVEQLIQEAAHGKTDVLA